MDNPWYVAITSPRAERIAKMQFDRENIESFLPLREIAPTKEKPINIIPLWPGYIFVRCTTLPERVTAAQRFIATAEGEAISVPPGVVEIWVDRADKDGLVEHYEPPRRTKYRPDDVVRINYGAFIGAFMTVIKHTGNRVRGFLICLGGQVVVDLHTEQVALALTADTTTSQWESSLLAKRDLALTA